MASPAQLSGVTLDKNLWKAALTLAMVSAAILVATQPAQAQTFTLIYSFIGPQDGFYPSSGVTIDGAGNLYGTTTYGGPGTSCYLGCGAVYKVTRRGFGWLFRPLYGFMGGNDGGNSVARIIIGPDGSLFGTTSQGGGDGCYGYGCGTVFNLRPPPHSAANVLGPWAETVLYRFNGGSDGDSPRGADLVFDQAGSFYGTTLNGGSSDNCQDGCGTVYKMTRSSGGWTESVIHSFAFYVDGQPWAGVIFDQSGSLYGTTDSGGPYGNGAVYQLVPSGAGWAERVLYGFLGGDDGAYPYGGLVMDQAGNLYGTTCCAGSLGGGTVYELTRAGDWSFSTLNSFAGALQGALAMDAAGNLYGATMEGGAYNFGSIFKLSPGSGGWTYTDLYDFCANGWPCRDGAFPTGTVARDPQGNLYGTTSEGGAHGGGVVWGLTP